MPFADAAQRNEYLRTWRAPQTYVCGCGAAVATRGARCYSCRWGKGRGLGERLDMPWSEDVASQEFVEAHRGGATLEEVGEELGLTRERVRQIEAVALRKLVPRLALVGVEPDDVAAMLAAKPDDRSLVG